MNTIVLNILSKNNLLVEREQFQLEFIESLFQNLISQEEIDESIKVSSIFGTFFNENISLVEGETYKISVTIKKEQIFGIAVQSLFRKALNKEPLTRFERNLLQQNIHNLDDNRLIRASYNISDEVKIMSLPNTEKKDMSITIKDGLEISKNKIDQLIYFSGIPLLENIINYKFQEKIL